MVAIRSAFLEKAFSCTRVRGEAGIFSERCSKENEMASLIVTLIMLAVLGNFLYCMIKWIRSEEPKTKCQYAWMMAANCLVLFGFLSALYLKELNQKADKVIEQQAQMIQLLSSK
jgi:predicted ABC-type exoprotein transport system permease subunit